jgi:Eco57I restriction-modification methylase
MPADAGRVQAAVRRHLDSGDLGTLFLTALGWDAPEPAVRLADGAASARKIAEKRGVGVWVVAATDAAAVERLDRQIEKQSHERLVVVEEADGLTWQWPERRRSGYVRRSRLPQRTRGQVADIVQRLAALRFEPGEDRDVTVLDVRDRVRRSFDTEKVDEAFFKDFKDCHELMGGKPDASVSGAITGIPSKEDRRWYASVLLNRLMFLYFLQKKGFLDNDTDYLRKRLALTTANGVEFYRDFLIPLFHNAIGDRGTASLAPETRRQIGDVPYLNGGVFAVHPLESRYDIHVPDEVFRRVFSVFEGYRWHLDDRATASGEEINPDILGHIFERYVNQKETGAFYTPDDATGWMAAGSIGVVLVDELAKLGVDPGKLVAGDPRRYMAAEPFFGEPQVDETAPFPEPGTPEAAAWDHPAAADVALPDETHWEVRDRLRHAHRVESELQSGAASDASAAFRYNIDLITVIADGIRQLTPKALETFWQRLTGISVLDPTCGSGAFLLAGLALLEDVADLVIARAGELADISVIPFYRELSAVTESARRLHVRQLLVLDCLYGTDIAAEAVDIARLRLYLALVAVMYDKADLRPLPDLEFNLVAGNLLVGVNTAGEMDAVVGGALWASQALTALQQQQGQLAASISDFRRAQEERRDAGVVAASKAKARAESDALRDALTAALHKAVANDTQLDAWVASHQPLHMLAEFPEVTTKGGFDVVIGNPPYVKRSNVVKLYRFDGYATSDCPDIYAPCTERALALVRDGGVLSFVLPLSAAWSDDFPLLRKQLAGAGSVAMACFGRNPDAIFRGVGTRNAITFVRRGAARRVDVTAMQRWTSRYRPALFGDIRWQEVGATMIGAGWLRLGSDFAVELWRRLGEKLRPLRVVPGATSHLYSKKTALYWVPVSPEELRTIGALGGGVETNEQMRLDVASVAERDAALAVLTSTVGLVLWNAISDDFHVVHRHFAQIPAVPRDAGLLAELAEVGRDAAQELSQSDAAHLWTPYGGYWVESLDTREARGVTDRAVGLLLGAIGLRDRWDELEAWYWRTMKTTGERPGTVRSHEPPTRAIKGGKRRHGTVAKVG